MYAIRSYYGNGLHKLTHHPADKGHRHHCQNDGDGRDVGRRTDLIGCLTDQQVEILPLRLFKMQPPVNVFNNDNGIIDDQTDTEQKGKKGNSYNFV